MRYIDEASCLWSESGTETAPEQGTEWGVLCDWLIDWLIARAGHRLCVGVWGVWCVFVYDDCVVCDWLIDWLIDEVKQQQESAPQHSPPSASVELFWLCSLIVWLIDWACVVVVVVVGVVGVVLVVVCFVGGLLTFVCMAVVRFDWRHSVCLTDWLIAWVLSCLID